jgi:ketosteroid isomerase-like protein
MRRSLLLSLLLVLAVAVTAVPGARAESKPSKAPASDVVKAAELKRFEAAQKNDLDTLGKLLADDLTYTHSTGVLETKAVFLESLKSGKLQFKKIEPGDLQVRVYGTTAIINGTAKLAVVSDGHPKDVNIRFTDVWVSRAGQWQMVAWQSTKLQ